MSNKNVEGLKKLCVTIGNLPSSYVDSLSYYECLMWLCNYIEKTIVPAINENAAAITELQTYVEEYLVDMDEVKQQIIEIFGLINNLQAQITSNDEDINDLYEKVGNLKTYTDNLVADNFNTLKQYVDYNDEVLDDKITNIQIGQIQVYNPTNGLLQPLQQVLNDIAEQSNKDGLTATEFDALELTATAFDAYEITAHEFDSEGKIILV